MHEDTLSVHKTMETLIDMCGDSSEAKSGNMDQNDLATIACSLLTEDKISVSPSTYPNFSNSQSEKKIAGFGNKTGPSHALTVKQNTSGQISHLGVDRDHNNVLYPSTQSDMEIGDVPTLMEDKVSDWSNSRDHLIKRKESARQNESKTEKETGFGNDLASKDSSLTQTPFVSRGFINHFQKNNSPREQSLFDILSPEPIHSAEWEEFYNSMKVGNGSVYSENSHHLQPLDIDEIMKGVPNVSLELTANHLAANHKRHVSETSTSKSINPIEGDSRGISQKKPMQISSTKDVQNPDPQSKTPTLKGMTPLKPLAVSTPGSQKNKKQNKGARNSPQKVAQNQNTRFNDKGYQNLPLVPDKSDSSDSGSLKSVNLTPEKGQVFFQRQRDPLDPLGLLNLWNSKAESFENPKLQRKQNKSKPSGTSLSQDAFKQGKSKNKQISPRKAPPPWAPTQGPTKGDVQVKSTKKHDQSFTNDKISSFRAITAGHLLEGNGDDLSVKSHGSTEGLQKKSKPSENSRSMSEKPSLDKLNRTTWDSSSLQPSPSNTSGTNVKKAFSLKNSQNIVNTKPHFSSICKAAEKKNAQVQQFESPSVPSHKPDFVRNKLVLRGVKSPVGVIRRYILEKQPVMVILRGLPGSGKSYLAKLLISEAQEMGVIGITLSTDDFFTQSGNYNFNRNDIGEAHEWNKKRALQFVKQSKSPIIIDNTNTTMWELLPYAVLALEYRYDIQMFEPDTPWKFKLGELTRRNAHSVGKEIIRKMKERYEILTLEQVLTEASKVLSKRRGICLTMKKPFSAHVETTESFTSTATGTMEDIPPHEPLSSSNDSAANSDLASHDNPNHTSWTDDAWIVTVSASPQPQRQKAIARVRRNNQSRPQVAGTEITSEYLRHSLKTAILSTMNLEGLSVPPFKESISELMSDQGSKEAVSEEILVSDAHSRVQCQAGAANVENVPDNGELVPSCAETSSLSKSSEKTAVLSNLGLGSLGQKDNMPEMVLPVKTMDYCKPCLPQPCIPKEIIASDDSPMLNTNDSTISEVNKDRTVIPGRDDLEDSIVESESEQSTSSTSDLPFILAQGTPSVSTSESFRSCVSDLDAASEGKSCDGEKLEAPSASDFFSPHPLSLFVKCEGKEQRLHSPFESVPVPSLAHFRYACGNNGPDFESNENEEVNEDIEPDTPATIVGDDQSPFLPRASTPSEILSGDASSETVASHSEIGNNSEPVVMRDFEKSHIFEETCGEHEPESAVGTFAETPVESYSDLICSMMEILKKPSNSGISKESVPDTKSVPSLVAYSDSDSEHEAPVMSSMTGEQSSSTEMNSISRDVNNQEKTVSEKRADEKEFTQHSVESSRDHSPETLQSGVSSTDKEGSPCPLTPLNHDVLPKRKQRVRVRKGRGQGPFLDKALKTKSKAEDWSSYFVPPPGNAKLDTLFADDKLKCSTVETQSALCQCDPYIFSMVHKLNSPSFKSLQPVDDTAICDDGGSGLKIVLSSSSNTSFSIQNKEENESDFKKHNEHGDSLSDISFVPRKSETTDRSTNTEDALDQGQIDLETLQSCFPEYSSQELEQVLAICHNNLEWVTSHLLDSPALIDQEDDNDKKISECAFSSDGIGEKEFLSTCKDEVFHSDKSFLKQPLSLAELSREVVKHLSPVDADDLEMQVIQAGQTRLQTIEHHHWSRRQSSSTKYRSEHVWAHDIRLEDFTGTVEPDEFWEWSLSPTIANSKTSTYLSSPSSLKYQPFNMPKSPKPPTQQYSGSNFLSSLMEEKKFSGPLLWQKSEESRSNAPEVRTPSHQDTDEGNFVSSSANSEPDQLTSSRPVVPQEFVHCLEKMFGTLGRADEKQGLLLEEHIALKVYKCLKLQVSSRKIVNAPSSFDSQVQNDEALARALQEEEDLSSMVDVEGSSAKLSKQVPGWTSESPPWMQPSLFPTRSISQSPTSGRESQNMINSISNTLHCLRGTSGLKKPTPFKFQHHRFANRATMTATRNRNLLDAGSVWAGSPVRTGRQADSLHSIMAEERVIEERRLEQLKTLETLGNNQALSTKIKRSQLSELFPTLAPDMLEEVFEQSRYSLEKTVAVLQSTYNISPAPAAHDMEEAMVKEAEEISKKDFAQHQPAFTDQEDETFMYDEYLSSVSYQDLRAEAQFYRGLAKECQEQASRHDRDGMHGAALFYRQRAKKYKEEEYDANHRAADFLFNKGSERLDKENTLDLHFYHLDEAIAAVNTAVAMKEEDRRLHPCKKNSYLNIVTGRGKNSKGGIPRLKPAIIRHLNDHYLPFEEKSPGMLRVQIGQRL